MLTKKTKSSIIIDVARRELNIKIKQKKGKEFFCYYNGFDRSNSSIKYLEVNCSLKKNKVGAKSLEIFEKYEVDVLGNVSKIKKEKRKGV